MSEYVYGINPVHEGLKNRRRKPLELLLQRDLRSRRIDELREAAAAAGVPVRGCEKVQLERLAGNPHHQGAILKVTPFNYAALDELLDCWQASARPAFFLILDGITDPHNFGALLRNADGAGCHGVIVTRDRGCPVTGVVDKAASGAIDHLPICQVTNLARTLDELKKAGVWIYGLAGEAAADLYATDLHGDMALVVGSEGKGLRPLVREHCDHLLAIPMAGGVESLNVASAAAVALYEIVRQRHL
ncbi:MAG: 23S rRNA (guanosine(2251)-2'-O)-methyltransferase RlmB [Desulfuromonadales bacterium]|nr:23S rRNA (guanosine(2251)-2'-O)-methyltransferase RlmB [Desulfuromonadales bacterium]